jgi:hypothetical protein
MIQEMEYLAHMKETLARRLQHSHGAASNLAPAQPSPAGINLITIVSHDYMICLLIRIHVPLFNR